jgi:hypothetical protein
MSFCLRTPKLESQNWDSRNFGGPILCANLWLRWGVKKIYSPWRELSNGIWHTIFTQGNQADFLRLINLTPNLSFGHYLYYKSPNGSCEPILSIYVPKTFQWYKKPLNPMNFDPCNCSIKIRESIGTLTLKMGVHLGVWGFIPSFSCTFKNMKCDS